MDDERKSRKVGVAFNSRLPIDYCESKMSRLWKLRVREEEPR